MCDQHSMSFVQMFASHEVRPFADEFGYSGFGLHVSCREIPTAVQ